MATQTQLINLNIQPQATIYALFSRLNYQEWYALAEFVDNSTASYYAHIKELEDVHFDKLVIEISYDKTTDTITIEDNAFGMELEDFKKAILLGNETKLKSRNEFGFGLKTAATWFGRRWTVESTQLNSSNRYTATIDIDQLVSEKKNDTDIKITQADLNEHFTKITISKLNRKLNTNKIKKNIVNVLNNMYRRDLKSGKIEIVYNSITLSFDDFPILNFRNKDWKKDLSLNFDFDGKTYSAKGFVGIMEPGGYDKTGFALFRNNRAIVCNYKPSEIFGSQPQTQVSLKLFGEIDMDDFEVNQAKDGFSWSRDLEEKFVENLKSAIPDFIDVAKMSKKDREAEREKNNPPVPQTNANGTETKNVVETKNIENSIPNNVNDSVSLFSEISTTQHVENETTSVPPLVVTTPVAINSVFKFAYNETVYSVSWETISGSKFLYKFNIEGNELTINLNHEYIKTVSEYELRKTASRFILTYVLSEQNAKQCSTERGCVKAAAVHNNLDKLLSSLIEVD